MPFTSIPNSSIDADSPLDTTLFTYLRDNDNYLKARFDPSTGHNHDGTTDSGAQVSVPDGFVTTAKIADMAVTQPKLQNAQIIDTARLVDANVTLAKLKLAQGSYTISGTSDNYITIQQYSHDPHANIGYTGSYYEVKSDPTVTGILRQIHFYSTAGYNTLYWDYHTN